MADWDGFLNSSNGSGEGKRDHSNVMMRVSSKDSSSSALNILPTSPRKVPRANDITLVPSSSAPVDIPDWSKIYGKKVSRVAPVGEGLSHNHNGCGDEEEDDVMIPPHEWIARKLARTQISSFSVCEGIGRTLKGRDLSKVRNAVLTKTGFIE